MRCQEIIELLQRQSPERYACSWDNVGLLVGSSQKEVSSLYIALDATDQAIAQAVQEGADMLLTHHPLIFGGIKRVSEDDFIGRRVIALISHGISYYAMHTNFDVMGMAGLAAEKMGMSSCQVLDVTWEQGQEIEGIGRVGLLPCEMTVEECAQRAKEAFGIGTVKVFGDPGQKVRKVALCPGSGKSVIEKALSAGAGALVTGDIDHHEGIDAAA